MGQDGELHDAGSTCPSECEEEEAHRGDEGVVCASTGKRTGEGKRISRVRTVGSALTGRDEAEAAGGDREGKDAKVSHGRALGRA